MFEPVKMAFGDYLIDFFNQISPTTDYLEEYIKREPSEAIMMAPSKMVDLADDMYQKLLRLERQDLGDTTPPILPVIIFAVSRDYIPISREYSRQMAERRLVVIPDDPKERAFGLRVLAGDLRAQVVIFAPEIVTARSLAAQFLLYIDDFPRRRFASTYRWAGIDTYWPCQLETSENPAMSIANEAKNLSILAIDLNIHVHAPVFDAPKEGEANDGKGVPGTDDPPGYPLVEEVHDFEWDVKK